MAERHIILLVCEKCSERNYSTVRTKKVGAPKLKLYKYCKFCRIKTEHKETKVAS